jgi:hypothetical protein
MSDKYAQARELLPTDAQQWLDALTPGQLAKLLQCTHTLSSVAGAGAQSNVQGVRGELTVERVLAAYSPSREGKKKSGDLILRTKPGPIMVEVKNYARAVPTEELTKFKRDLERVVPAAGLFVSMNSQIRGKQPYTLERWWIGGKWTPVAIVQCTHTDMIIAAVESLLHSLESAGPERVAVDHLAEKLQHAQSCAAALRDDLQQSGATINTALWRSASSLSALEHSIRASLSETEQLHTGGSSAQDLVDELKSACVDSVHRVEKIGGRGSTNKHVFCADVSAVPESHLSLVMREHSVVAGECRIVVSSENAELCRRIIANNKNTKTE